MGPGPNSEGIAWLVSRYRLLIVWMGGLIMAGGATAQPAASPESLPLIPRPVQVTTQPGVFQLSPQAVVFLRNADPQVGRVGRYLADGLSRALGRTVAVHTEGDPPADAPTIELSCDEAESSLGEEGYRLTIGPRQVRLRAFRPAGLFYAAQTLRQLLPADFERPAQAGEERVCPLPALQITDRPRFRWRGLMLDCSRTFLSIDYLRRYVDLLALHKLNVLHLHLTDDQGWRLESVKYPRLTEIGARWDKRIVNDPDGFYTRQQMRELIEYAAERFVTIVPEIEMPAHCLAALTAYPNLACRQLDYYIVPFHIMIDPNATSPPPPPYGVMCVGNEEVFRFVEDVLGEVIDLFPSPYIHIGGDECPKDFWKNCEKCQARKRAEGLRDEEELQSYFIRRVGRFIESRGRKMVGWDEILEGGLADGAVVMSWRGVDGAVAAARMGHAFVNADRHYLYFDYTHETTPLEKVYGYDPLPPGLDARQAGLMLGAQGQMWTHIARNEPEIDTWIWPRAVALAEIVWSPAGGRDFADFEGRLHSHLQRLRVLRVPYHRAGGPARPRPGGTESPAVSDSGTAGPGPGPSAADTSGTGAPPADQAAEPDPQAPTDAQR